MTTTRVRITNAHNERRGSLWMSGWHLAARINTIIFHTDRDGYGLWAYDAQTGDDRQILGTCQLRARTFDWFRRYLRRAGYCAQMDAAE